MAASADCDAARKAHETLAGEYEHRIGQIADAGRTDIAPDVNGPMAVAITARDVESG